MSSGLLALLTALVMTGAPPDAPKAAADSFRPDPAWKEIGPNLWFDREGRKLILRARVALREGPLEHLLCLRGTKEHESILSTEAIPRQIHAGLLLTGAEPGHPVRFLPRFEPPAGTPIAIDLEWLEGDKTRHADARQWVWDERGKRELDKDWVFAGSELIEDPQTKKPYYTADDGDLFTVANFANAILDLPIASTASDADRSYVAHTERIPPRGTMVTMILHPRKPPATDTGNRPK